MLEKVVKPCPVVLDLATVAASGIHKEPCYQCTPNLSLFLNTGMLCEFWKV
eukprot:m.222534 g.222534  ORF g.222534 m.222534 type:complete len:51 (-) comp26330_c0_seq5:148-300(-)